MPVEFLTLAEVHARARLEGPSEDWGKQSLVIGPAPGTVGSEFIVSVAYFRAGYTPNDYPTENEWAARRVIEQSSAVKCPNTGYQLAGTKAIQASLCLPGVLERFLTVEESVELRRCFAAQYSLVALTGATLCSLVYFVQQKYYEHLLESALYNFYNDILHHF